MFLFSDRNLAYAPSFAQGSDSGASILSLFGVSSVTIKSLVLVSSVDIDFSTVFGHEVFAFSDSVVGFGDESVGFCSSECGISELFVAPPSASATGVVLSLLSSSVWS